MRSRQKARSTDEPRHSETCFLCGSSFQFGPHLYDGKWIRDWRIIVCMRCRSANWDGIVPTTYPQLAAHFKAAGIQPVINAKGWISWP